MSRLLHDNQGLDGTAEIGVSRAVRPVLAEVSREPEFDLRTIVAGIWKGRILILLLVIFFLGYAYNRLINATPLYVATMVVSRNSGETPMLPGPLGALGVVAGISLQDNSSFDEFVAITQTVVLAKVLQAKYGYLQQIFRGNWDVENKAWTPPTGFRAELGRRVRKFLGFPEWVPPSVHDFARFIGEKIAIKERGGAKGIYSIKYENSDKAFALKFLTSVYQESETLLRESRKRRIRAQADYLRRRVEVTAIIEYRLSLIQLLAEQEKKLMILESNLPVASMIIDPPTIADRPIMPSISLHLFFSVVTGIGVGILLIVLFELVRYASRATMSRG